MNSRLMNDTGTADHNVLSGRCIWLTRPRFQLPALQTAIESAGGDVLALPMFEIEALEYSPELKQRILNLDQYDLLFFISTNAARLGMECIEHFWPQLPAHLRFFSVGPTTAETLAEFDVKAYYPTKGMNSEALLAIRELQDIDGKKALIFRGKGGREILAKGLRKKGVRAHYAEVYERSLPDYADDYLDDCIRQHAPDAIVISSGEALDNLVQLLGERWAGFYQQQLLVSSQRIAQQAKTLGFEKVIVMAGATDGAIMDSLRNLYA